MPSVSKPSPRITTQATTGPAEGAPADLVHAGHGQAALRARLLLESPGAPQLLSVVDERLAAASWSLRSHSTSRSMTDLCDSELAVRRAPMRAPPPET